MLTVNPETGLNKGEELRIFVSAQSMATQVKFGRPLCHNGRPKDVKAIMTDLFPNEDWGSTGRVLLRQVVKKMEDLQICVPESVYKVIRECNV